MNRALRFRRARARLCLAALSCLASLAWVSPARADSPEASLVWRLYRGLGHSESCTPPTGDVLSCGSWGDYWFRRDEFPPDVCGADAAGNESPPAFVPSGWPVPPPEEWFPCRDGHCFATAPGDQPWAAVIDWNDPHGWSVAETLLQAADGRVAARLFPLDQPPSPVAGSLAELAVGDAHLLAQLCTLVEEVENGPWGAPLVVNVSAGRLAGGGSGGELVPAQDESTLESQVLGVIEHLASTHGIAFVAAGGHHRVPLFPAHLPPVLAVGPVDLPNLRDSGQALPSWQADDGVMALFPGYGLELWSPGPPHDCWSVPAGSSFASATAAGWIAAYRDRGGQWVAADAQEAWAPVEVLGGFHLSRAGNLLAGTGLGGPSMLVAGAVDGTACGEGPGPVGVHLELEVMAPVSDLTQTVPSLPELVDEIGPSPENEPCVPCDIPTAYAPGPRVVRLHASRPLAPYRILDLYLLTGGTFYRLRSPDKAAILQQIEDGAAATLELVGFDGVHLEHWHEVLLVFHLGQGEQELWSSVPIDVLPP